MAFSVFNRLWKTTYRLISLSGGAMVFSPTNLRLLSTMPYPVTLMWCEAPTFGVTEGQAVAALAEGVGQLLAAEEKAKAVARGAAKFYS